MAVDVEPTTIDSSMVTSNGRQISNVALGNIASFLGTSFWIQDGPDISANTLLCVFAFVQKFMIPSLVINFDQFRKNVTKKSASGFADLLRKALGVNDSNLWLPVVTHDVFHLVIPDDPESELDELQLSRALQEKVNLVL